MPTKPSIDAAAEDATDRELVSRVQRGEKRAFDLLVLRHQHKVAGLISRFVRDREEVADLVQDVFIKAYRALPRFRGDSAFYTWIFRIAINTSKNYLASRGRRPFESDVDLEDAEHLEGGELLRDANDPQGELNRERLQTAIDAAIAALPPDLRSAVTLREYDGLSYEQIADIMECPVGTVRSRIFRAREAIDEKIRPLLDRSLSIQRNASSNSDEGADSYTDMNLDKNSDKNVEKKANKNGESN